MPIFARTAITEAWTGMAELLFSDEFGSAMNRFKHLVAKGVCHFRVGHPVTSFILLTMSFDVAYCCADQIFEITE